MTHFCTCQNTACRCHPSNHSQGCDLCIQKELRKGEIPSCFFNLVIRPGETVEDCTMAAFARRVLEREAEMAASDKQKNGGSASRSLRLLFKNRVRGRLRPCGRSPARPRSCGTPAP